jgi:hypothetical protein
MFLSGFPCFAVFSLSYSSFCLCRLNQLSIMAPYAAISSGGGRSDVAPATAPMRDPEIIGEESQPLFDGLDHEDENGADMDEQDIKIDKMIKEKKSTTSKSASSTSAAGKKKGSRSK